MKCEEFAASTIEEEDYDSAKEIFYSFVLSLNEPICVNILRLTNCLKLVVLVLTITYRNKVLVARSNSFKITHF